MTSVRSIDIFRKHIVESPQPNGGGCTPWGARVPLSRLDASGVLSPACYEDWLRTRSRDIGVSPEKTFQRYAPVFASWLHCGESERPSHPSTCR